MAVPLNTSALAQLAQKGFSSLPTYARDPTRASHHIVHIGVGGFHRAHLALYTHEVMLRQSADGGDTWCIIGAGITSADERMHAALAAQDFLYTLVERSNASERAHIVGSVSAFVLGHPCSRSVVAAIAAPKTKMCSLTVTEAGYLLNPVTKELNLQHPTIVSDLAHATADRPDAAARTSPSSVVGVLAAALQHRRDHNAGGITILSCDNIQHNGNVVRAAVLAFAAALDSAQPEAPSLASWISRNCTFPNSMVDRITPMTKEEDIARVKAQWHVEDRWPVVCEGFMQWVVEDTFVGGLRPQWERYGRNVQFVPDVAPYETMKLRLLNASHLAVACLGDLLGLTSIGDTMNHPTLQQYMVALMKRETGPTIPLVPGVDLEQYQRELVARFSNEAIYDTVQRVATDAPLNTVLDSLRDRLKQEANVPLLALALAAWLRRARGGVGETQREIMVVHPLAAKLKAIGNINCNDPRPLMGITSLFGDLGQNSQLVQQVERFLTILNQPKPAGGVVAALSEALRLSSSRPFEVSKL